jgi:phosphatidylglycerol:prolipoprotein diacylglycerol transferase
MSGFLSAFGPMALTASPADSFLPVPDPVAFSIFGIDIMWYAVCVVMGMVCGVGLAMKLAPRKGIDPEHLLDIALWALPLGIVGARIYYVVFTWGYYKDHLDQILNLRGGGLAIHGGLILGIGTAIFMIRKFKGNILDYLDILMPGIALGQAIGRWGNYFNSEAHGVATDLPWAIYADGKLVHPTFLYESIWCLLLCIFLVWADKHLRGGFKGRNAALYLILYSIERFFVEGLRTDSLMIGNLRQAQLISLVMIAGGVILFFVLKKAEATKCQKEQKEQEEIKETEKAE